MAPPVRRIVAAKAMVNAPPHHPLVQNVYVMRDIPGHMQLKAACLAVEITAI
jgi:hypothetical protein